MKRWTMESGGTRWSRRVADRRAVKRRSNPARGAVLGEAELALLRPRLLPLSAEQHSEAAELLSELLVMAARWEPSSVPGDEADERVPWRRKGSTREPGRRRPAA
jgi:hypothetical protein